MDNQNISSALVNKMLSSFNSSIQFTPALNPQEVTLKFETWHSISEYYVDVWVLFSNSMTFVIRFKNMFILVPHILGQFCWFSCQLVFYLKYFWKTSSFSVLDQNIFELIMLQEHIMETRFLRELKILRNFVPANYNFYCTLKVAIQAHSAILKFLLKMNVLRIDTVDHVVLEIRFSFSKRLRKACIADHWFSFISTCISWTNKRKFFWKRTLETNGFVTCIVMLAILCKSFGISPVLTHTDHRKVRTWMVCKWLVCR